MLYLGTMAQQMAMADKTVDVLLEQISLYTEQLEAYDRGQGDAIMACITFGGVLISIVISLFVDKKNINKIVRGENSLKGKRIMAILFLIVPSITTLSLYIFSMQCRRVAFFRGYLRYLEEELSKRVEVPLLFNNRIAGKFFGECITNIVGPWIMICFVLAIMGVGVVLVWRYSTFIKEEKQEEKRWCLKFGYYFLFRILPGICIVACIVFISDLWSNSFVAEEVYQYCIRAAGG